MAGLQFLRVVSNDQIAASEKADYAALEERQNQPLILGIAGYLRQCWEAARSAKDLIEDEMLRALRQRNGEYEVDKRNAIISQGGSDVYMMITEVKCRAAESWLRDIMLDTGMTPWSLTASPIPELAPQQTQEIQQAYAEKVLEIVQTEERAPSLAEQMAIKEMIAQDYRFTILQAAQTKADKMALKIADQFQQGGFEK